MFYDLIVNIITLDYSGNSIPANCDSREVGNPGIYWMPDQVRHDGVSLFNCRVNKSKRIRADKRRPRKLKISQPAITLSVECNLFAFWF